MTSSNQNLVAFHYIIKTPDHGDLNFTVFIDKETNYVVFPEDIENNYKNLPSWTELDYFKCAHCPYAKTQKSHCPVAANISHVVDTFRDEKSYMKVHVTVNTEDRSYEKDTDLQTALQSLLGLLMAGSDCVHLHFLKGLVTTHLPFSNLQETTLRIFGYSMQQALKENLHSELTLEKHAEQLAYKYEQLTVLNQQMIQRITSVKTQGESIQNAIVILNVFSSLIPMEYLVKL